MCGQFALTSPPAAIADHFGLGEVAWFPPRPHILAGEPIALVVARPFTHGAERRMMLARWGFLPGFARDLESFPLIVNARAESVIEKPSFAAAFKRRRALAPADGFYISSGKRLHRVAAADGAPLGLAALYETYLDPNGSEIDTACILTTSANADMAPLCDRMPVIVPRAAFAAWLDGEATPLSAAGALLAPAPQRLLLAEPAGAAGV